MIIVLVGPKGSGKTTIGRVLERSAALGEPGAVHFLEVEAIALGVRAAHDGPIDEAYAQKVFAAIEAAVDAAASTSPVVLIETTGASAETKPFLDRLATRHPLRLARIIVGEATCRERMATRDGTRQVSVPDELVAKMHALSEALAWPWDLELVNDPPLGEAEIVRAFAPLMRST